MTNESLLKVLPGYQRAIRFGAAWTMAISPYLIVYFIIVILVGSSDTSDIASMLVIAVNSPLAFQATAFLDGLFHALFFVTTVTLFIILRETFPVRASLILVCGAWQMLFGFSKGLISAYVFPRLGLAYLAIDTTFLPALIPTAGAMDGLRNALQWMDSLGVLFVWVLVISPDPGFLLVVLFSLPWLFILGRWMKMLAL